MDAPDTFKHAPTAEVAPPLFAHNTPVAHLKSGNSPRARALVVEQRRRDAGMAKPVRHLTEVGPMLQRIGTSRGAEGVRPKPATSMPTFFP